MKTIAVIGVLLMIVGFAVWYVCRAKRRHRCIGCPHCDSCNNYCIS